MFILKARFSFATALTVAPTDSDINEGRIFVRCDLRERSLVWMASAIRGGIREQGQAGQQNGAEDICPPPSNIYLRPNSNVVGDIQRLWSLPFGDDQSTGI